MHCIACFGFDFIVCGLRMDFISWMKWNRINSKHSFNSFVQFFYFKSSFLSELLLFNWIFIEKFGPLNALQVCVYIVSVCVNRLVQLQYNFVFRCNMLYCYTLITHKSKILLFSITTTTNIWTALKWLATSKFNLCTSICVPQFVYLNLCTSNFL